MKVKLMIILMSSIVILPAIPETWSAEAMLPHLSTFGLFLLIFNDVILGLTVSLTVNMMLEVTVLLGEFIGINVGFAMSRQFDPNSDSENSSISVMFMQIFLVLFLAFDMHLSFIKIAALSFSKVGPGQNILTPDHLTNIVEVGSLIFVYALQLSLPIIAVMLMINICLGIISRFGQDFQVLMISFPIRLGTGLLLLAALMPVFTSTFSNIYDLILENFGLVLGF